MLRPISTQVIIEMFWSVLVSNADIQDQVIKLSFKISVQYRIWQARMLWICHI